MKKAVKYLKRIIATVTALIAAYFIAAIILSLISTKPEATVCEQKKEIYLSTNGIHLDIILAKRDINKELVEKLEIPGHTNFIAFGWGDRGFYLYTPTWGDLEFATLMKALFLQSESVIHLTRYREKRADWYPLDVCESQIEKINAYIERSFAKNPEGRFIEIKNFGYTTYDTFYEAEGSFTFIKTCNIWVNNGLKAADIKTSVWSPFDNGVLYQVKRAQKGK